MVRWVAVAVAGVALTALVASAGVTALRRAAGDAAPGGWRKLRHRLVARDGPRPQDGGRDRAGATRPDAPGKPAMVLWADGLPRFYFPDHGWQETAVARDEYPADRSFVGAPPRPRGLWRLRRQLRAARR